MAKGHKTGGRAAGTPNKASAQAREAIALFVDGNAHRLQEWLDQIAADDPKRAFELFQSVIEYHVPKLGRTEHVGDAENPIGIRVIERVLVRAKTPDTNG
jgi:hypothetical protein